MSGIIFSFVLLAAVYVVSAQRTGQFIPGRYELVSDVDAADWKAYMKAVGVDETRMPFIRKLTSMEIQCTPNVESCNLRVFTPTGVHEQRFAQGKEEDATYFDGRRYKATFNLEENTITQNLDFGNVKSVCKNMFSRDGLRKECSVNGVDAVVQYKRVA